MLLFTTVAFASEKVSPALDIIARENGVIKSGVLSDGEMCFDVDDFDLALWVNVGSIKVTELPSTECGRLMLDNLYVVENQVIYRDDFSMLKFVNTGKSSEAVFKFKPNGHEYEIECSVISLKEVNLSPASSNGATISAWTMKNIPCFGTLLGFDPEGDELVFEITKYPKKALLCMTNNKTGDYTYTPYQNAKGKDSFSYRVRDSYGNYSPETTVDIRIDRRGSNLVFSDVSKMDLNAAITVYENNLMECAVNADGTLCFNPNEEISRQEFIVLVMRAMGVKEAPSITKTRFADDDEIKPEYKGYLESAFSLGFIEGANEVDGVHIYPKRSITLAEAAVIISRILDSKSDTCLAVFADDDEIPSWARGAIETLTEEGILKKTEGKISPNSPLTKAQVAGILMALIRNKK
jgi:hypothetical protein